MEVAETVERRLQHDRVISVLILLGDRLSGLTAIQLCRKLRLAGVRDTHSHPEGACSLIERRVEGRDVGADDHLTKPFVPAEFHARFRARRRRGLHNRKIRSGDKGGIVHARLSFSGLDPCLKSCLVETSDTLGTRMIRKNMLLNFFKTSVSSFFEITTSFRRLAPRITLSSRFRASDVVVSF